MSPNRQSLTADAIESLDDRTGQGKIEAMERELETLHPLSFAWALSCADGRREEAEDLLQTVYLKIAQGKARFSGRSSLKTWLFAVIRRTAADQRRRRGIYNLLLGRWLLDRKAAPSPAPSPGERLLSDERKERVHRALGALSERQRQVLELVFFHDRSLREVAEVLGLSLGTARIHYHRAKVAVLKQLGEEVRDG